MTPPLSFPDSAAISSSPTRRTWEADTPTARLVGPQLGPFSIGQLLSADTYEVTSTLGLGGMGVVYDAHDRPLRRRVAIKTAILPVFASVLRAEAQALASLRSPSFPAVYTLAKHDEHDLIVMERLYGERLDERIEQAILQGETISILAALDILLGIARALMTAHGAGIAQRDVKPANVMICGDGERIVLFDLGLVVPEVLVAPNVTLSGSAEYVAPELLTGSVHKGDGPLVDLYALGIVAFELLTGRTPYQSDVIDQVLARHLCAEIPDVRDTRSDVPAPLAKLITDLIAKAPTDRPGSAQAVLWDLMHIKAQSVRSHTHRPSSRPSHV